MEIQEIFNKLNISIKAGKELVTGSLKVFPPNGQTKISINETINLRFNEHDDDIDNQRNIYHQAINYYFIKKVGQPGWQYVGESKPNDWLNMWEISVPMGRLDGTGVYAVQGIMYAENDNSFYFSTDTCKFEMEQ